MREKVLNILKNKRTWLSAVCGSLLFATFYLASGSNKLSSTQMTSAPNTEDIHVVFNVDDNYAKFLSVTMISILQNTDEHLHFHILTDGLSETSLNKLNELKKIKPFELDIIKIDDKRIAQIPDYFRDTINSVATYRLLASSLLPNLDKVIYLDVDLVLLGDIKEYWQIDVNDYYLAAAVDPLNEKEGMLKNLPLPDKALYFNSGVMILNLKKWRQDDVEKKFFENTAKYAGVLLLPDQDLLNLTLLPQVKYLDKRYNFMIESEDLEKEHEFLTIHWAGFFKPWEKKDGIMAEYFWGYAEYSPFYPEIAQMYYSATPHHY
ncbi:MAG: glycosyltransferase family 8 protein [Alphaproteobacteria bacterium]|nr:glycosyltransferase family 8 protein [Alphaproteobacteria bacterium]